MPAKKIMLIRHSEKPDPMANIHGVSFAGEPDYRSLSVRGWQRSSALLALFAKGSALTGHQQLAVPDAIYACEPDIKSSRSLNTVELLAEVLSIPIHTHYGNDDEAALAERVAAEEGTVLICWKHGGLPLLATHILGDPALHPRHWPADRFDMIGFLTGMQARRGGRSRRFRSFFSRAIWSIQSVDSRIMDRTIAG